MTRENEARLQELVDRLERGSKMINERRSAGLDTTAWELHWTRLLDQYIVEAGSIEQLEARRNDNE